jgi:hypothetical protein
MIGNSINILNVKYIINEMQCNIMNNYQVLQPEIQHR